MSSDITIYLDNRSHCRTCNHFSSRASFWCKISNSDWLHLEKRNELNVECRYFGFNVTSTLTRLEETFATTLKDMHMHNKIERDRRLGMREKMLLDIKCRLVDAACARTHIERNDENSSIHVVVAFQTHFRELDGRHP